MKEYWKELIIKSQEGDREAFDQLMQELYSFVKAIVIKNTKNIVDSDDITQECLIGVYKSLATFEVDKSLKPWLYSIIRFKCCDYFRKMARKEVTILFDENIYVTSDSSQTNILEREERKNGILEVVTALPDKLKNAIILVKIEDLSYKEAAAKEGISEAALRKRVSRAYKELGKNFKLMEMNLSE